MSARLIAAARIWPPVVLFLLVLALPALDLAFGIDKAPQPNDNRKLAGQPPLPDTIKRLHTYPRDLEAWFNDHFGFRKQFIRWHQRWKKSLYRETASSDVLVGEQDWMYYAGAHMIENLRGTQPLEIATLEALRHTLEERHRWLQRRGIAYIFAVAPNKESLYPEHLPGWLRDGVAAEPKLDRFYAYMREHSSVPVLDLRPALRATKAMGPLYFRQDSHWNTLGAFVAGQALVEALQAQNHQLPAPLRLDQLVLTPGSDPAGAGDLARMLGQEPREDLSVEITPPAPLKPLEVRRATAPSGEPPPAGTEPVYTLNPQGTVDAVVIHDSFGELWQPVLGWSFRRTDYVGAYLWGRAQGRLAWDAPSIERLQPQVVIDAVVERTLLNLTPDSIGSAQLPP